MFERKRLEKEKLLFEINQYKKANQLLESLPTFAQDNDEDKWKALSGSKSVYSEQDLATMQEQAVNLYYKNPIASGIIETLVNFIVGKSCEIVALDEDPQVQAYWDKFYRVNKFDMKSKELVRRTLRDGECFIRFFKPKEDGDAEKIRFIEPLEIKSEAGGKPTYGIETDPDDVEDIVSYHREFLTEDNVSVSEDIPADEMLHIKIRVDSNVKRGISFLVGIAEYIVAYKDWLDDRRVLNKIRTMFGLFGKTTSGNTLDNLAGKLPDSTTNKNTNSGDYKKKLFKRGSVLLTKGVEWDFKGLNINAGDTKDDGRAILLMIVAGTNLAEYMVTGDASNADYSSTMISESPAVKAFESWQDFFGKPFKEIYRRDINYGIDKNELPEESKKTITTFDKVKGIETSKGEDVPTNKECQVDFPILIHRNIKDETEALQIQRANSWISDRTASGKLGYDYSEECEQLEKEEIKQKNREQEKRAEKIRSEEE